jgi:dihydropteroate synthase
MIKIINIKNKSQIVKILKEIGVYSEGISLMENKFISYCIYLDNISNQAANILKQDMLSIGGDVAVHQDVVKYKQGNNPCVVIGTEKQMFQLITKMTIQPYGLKVLSKEIRDVLQSYTKKEWSMVFKDKKTIFKKPLIMGILNITPDSFYDGGKYNDPDKAVAQALLMVNEGADIIDIGGESSRPFSKPVSVKEEINRIIPIIRNIRRKSKILISIDTYKSETAKAALDEGADIINDISALRFDKRMVDVAVKYKAPVILMHMKGDPLTMQKNPEYGNVVDEIIKFLDERIKYCLNEGMNKNSIIIDPGIGFGKTTSHNFQILKHIDEFHSLGYPLLLGVSRKSLIGSVTGRETIDRLAGTISLLTYCLLNRTNIVRVHDVKETVDIIKITEELMDV